ncbi:uncharacterized protein TRUGW13939_03624 [Talaromyces rugulosus]|uniref:Mediator of RNA polymerase II transcription subunit 9 n=1 Tax=Talaromyces rugulosus TaxID=121627 RepID=A0A7H8QRK9_TALRU|nr:uncharacterized protein TRUGW13939_03624 [Talaromyces rugulosus]QKX56519.1 hypothetical protein TRUGW13939_03624 [Talaromyces rugulosus]
MASKSPVSAASQRKVSSTPDANPTTVPSSPHAFPTPQTFDFLPPLHALLLRLVSTTTTTSSTSSAPTNNNQTAAGDVVGAGSAVQQNHQQQQQQQQQQPKASQQSNTAHSTQTTIHNQPSDASLLGTAAATTSGVLPPLEAKNLPTAASAIKIRIQKARAVVEKLPDIDRSVTQQEDEIEELEERIARLSAVVAEFGRRAATTTSTTDVATTAGKEVDMMDTAA